MANYGIKVRWNIPQDQIDYSNLKATDFQILLSNFTFPSAQSGYQQPFTFPEELLICRTENNSTEHDLSVFKQINVVRPTNIKDSFFTGINKYLTTIEYEFKPVDEIITSIKQRENDANIKVRNSADFEKLLMVSDGISSKILAGQTVTENEQKIYNRVQEVRARAIDNDTNARRLIAIAQYNDGKPISEQQAFDINSGWEEDNITKLDIPFNEL